MLTDPDTSLVDEYLSWMATVRLRQPSTIEAYGSCLRQYVRWLYDRGVVLATATVTDVEEFQKRPRQKRGRGGNGEPATQRREIATLNGFYAWACGRGHLPSNPMDEVFAPPQRKRQPRPVADEVWLQAWHSTLSDPLRVAMGLGYFCGLRRAEVVRLTVDQLTDARIVDFIRKGGGEDTTPWRSMVEVYEQHLPHLGHEDFVRVMGRIRNRKGHITPYQDPAWFGRALRQHGFAFTPHQLRHSCATNLIRADVPLPIVSRLMNHTSITTTMLYVKAGGDELKAWLRR
jgi:site-specific recombinase XerD